jgi:hypothetical protein
MSVSNMHVGKMFFDKKTWQCGDSIKNLNNNSLHKKYV